MELNRIFKYQLGGYFNPFFTIYEPTEVSPRQTQSRRSSERTEKTDKDKLTEKDLFELLEKLEGLPNETENIKNKFLRLLRFASIAGEGDISNLYSTYVNTLHDITVSKANKELFDKVYNKTLQNGSMTDVAISSGGLIYTMDRNRGIKLFTPELWSKVRDSNKYIPLTVSNVLWIRSNHPKYANDNIMLNDISGSITLEDVDKMIKSSFDKIGESKSSAEYIVPKEAVKGHKIFESMISLGPNGYYKLTENTPNYDESYINATIDYIYSGLPIQAKSRIKLETVDGTTKSAKNFIKSLLLGTLDRNTTYSVDYLKEATKGSGSSNKDSASGNVKDNVATKLIKGYGAIEVYDINLGDDYATKVSANTLPLVGKDDNELGVRKPISDVTQGSLGGILDFRNASIAGSIISSYELNRIITDEGKIRSIDYPSVRNKNGTIIPDLSAETRLNKRKADLELLKMGINAYDKSDIAKHYNTINQVYLNNKLVAPYGPGGTINDDRWARFAIISVAADGRALENADKSLLQEVTNDYEADNIISAIQESDKNYAPNKPFLGMGGDAIYKGTMWIPLFESYNAATASLNLDESDTEQMDIRDLAIASRSRLTTEQP